MGQVAQSYIYDASMCVCVPVCMCHGICYTINLVEHSGTGNMKTAPLTLINV